MAEFIQKNGTHRNFSGRHDTAYFKIVHGDILQLVIKFVVQYVNFTNVLALNCWMI